MPLSVEDSSNYLSLALVVLTLAIFYHAHSIHQYAKAQYLLAGLGKAPVVKPLPAETAPFLDGYSVRADEEREHYTVRAKEGMADQKLVDRTHVEINQLYNKYDLSQ